MAHGGRVYSLDWLYLHCYPAINFAELMRIMSDELYVCEPCGCFLVFFLAGLALLAQIVIVGTWGRGKKERTTPEETA